MGDLQLCERLMLRESGNEGFTEGETPHKTLREGKHVIRGGGAEGTLRGSKSAFQPCLTNNTTHEPHWGAYALTEPCPGRKTPANRVRGAYCGRNPTG